MKFVGLLSGGKDSCFNIVLCQEHGHSLTCVANLYPNDEEIDELNSFMYQTAAHNVIPLLAQCFEVPIYRQAIQNNAKVQQLQYVGVNNEDEVEDMFVLLQNILKTHPDIKGVSCGAIVSNYQRFRIENICNRFGLIPLCYLWYRSRRLILEDIINRKIHAILVKVAGAGLEPYKHLGKSITTLQPTLYHLHHKYGLDLCGEGGEYETLVLDMPSFLKYRIKINRTEIILDNEDISVGNLRIVDFELEQKPIESSQNDNTNSSKILPRNNLQYDILSLLSKLYRGQLLTIINSSQLASSVSSTSPASSTSQSNNQNIDLFDIVYDKDSTISLKNTDDIENSDRKVQLHIGIDGMIQTSMIYSTLHSLSVKEQLNNIMLQLKNSLEYIGGQIEDIVFTHLFISNMNDFSEVNEEYNQWFGVNPPSRSCVAVPLPENKFICLEAIAYISSYVLLQPSSSRTSNIREVLHIQCMSDWAPMCIGPYSQANSILDRIVFVAGQISLDPGSMTLWNPMIDENFLNHFDGLHRDMMSCEYIRLGSELLLSFRHVARILKATKSCLENGLSCIIYISMDVIENRFHDIKQEKDKIIDFIMDLADGIIEWNAGEDRNDDQTIEFMNMNLFNRSIDHTYPDTVDTISTDSIDSNDYEKNHVTKKLNDESSVPINIICVKNLPRGSPVEIEYISTKLHHISNHDIRENMPLHSLYSDIHPMTEEDRPYDSSMNKNKNMITHTTITNYGMSPVISQWPLWPGNQMNKSCSNDDTTIQNNIEAVLFENQSIVGNEMDWKGSYRTRYYSQCLCSGFIDITKHPHVTSCINWNQVIDSVCHTLSYLFKIAEISMVLNLRSIRIFYPITYLSHSQGNQIAILLKNRMNNKYYNQYHGIESIPISIIPVMALKSIDTIMSLQYLGIDGLQIDTDTWVRSGS